MITESLVTEEMSLRIDGSRNVRNLLRVFFLKKFKNRNGKRPLWGNLCATTDVIPDEEREREGVQT